MKSDELKAAEWLIVGFAKNWTWQMLDLTVKQATGHWCSHFPFFPSGDHNWQGTAPVRGYVAQNWPKLSEFLLSAPTDKQIAAAKEVVKLKWNGERSIGSLNKAERADIAKTKKDLRGATTSYNQSRKIFKEHSTTNWNTCK